MAGYRSGGAASLLERRSVRSTQRRTLDPLQLLHGVDLRHERCVLRRITRVLAAPLSTNGRVLKARGLGRRRSLQPAEPVRRMTGPGDMIHVDTKQLARFEPMGHRISGERRLVSGRGAGYKKAHVVIDDATRLTYVEVLPDEKQARLLVCC